MTEWRRRVGVIGCGRIGMPVLQALHDGRLPGWTLAGVLARDSRDLAVAYATANLDEFLGHSPDLILDAAGPAALARFGVRALEVADVWTVSGAALADDRLYHELEAAGSNSGHRLRLIPGALAGLDGIAMASIDPQATLRLAIDLPPGEGVPGRVFSGTVRQAAMQFPDGVNVAVAAALVGPGLDLTRADVSHPASRHRRRLSLAASSAHAGIRASVEFRREAAMHPVAASLIACLRRETRTIWAG